VSVEPLKCDSCGVDGVLDRAGVFPEGCNEASFGVGWRCGKCGKLSVDVCPTGPIEPTPSSSLNCGAEMPNGTACTACGLQRDEADVGLSAAEAALSLAPDNGRAFYQRGWALGMLGRLPEAHASFRRLLELEPNNQDARRALNKIEAALPTARETKRPWWKVWN
jgi:tetratricopeptide (TPR) repeat protein